jgi:hypothetical protein
MNERVSQKEQDIERLEKYLDIVDAYRGNSPRRRVAYETESNEKRAYRSMISKEGNVPIDVEIGGQALPTLSR